MHRPWGNVPLSYRRIGPAERGVLASLALEPGQVERFLGPIAEIEAAVQRGPAHALIVIEAADALVGFYVVHPDPRNAACWWLGWFAIDVRQQGHGFGSQAMHAILDHLRHIAGCRRIRLLVAPDNTHALALYDKAGFRRVGLLASTGELVLELRLPPTAGQDERGAFVFVILAAGIRRVFRHRRLRLTVGPYAAWVIGVERGPPTIGCRVRAGRVAPPHDGPVSRRGRPRGLDRRGAAAAASARRAGLSRTGRGGVAAA